MDEILWRPTRQQIEASQMHRFMESAPGAPATYGALWSWSVDHPGEFWQDVWDFCDVISSERATDAIGKVGMPGTEWFPGARLNYAENLLRRADSGTAVIAVTESGSRNETSWADLRAQVARAQDGLQRLGVGPGDRVAALVPNTTEALVGMLACAAIGAIWSSCSPDFGPTGIVDRFGQIEPKVLIAVDGYTYNGTAYALGETIGSACARIPGLERVVIIEHTGDAIDTAGVASMPWSDLVAGTATDPIFAQLPFDHPLYILYSSGTTGRPKSIVHGAGGSLLKHLSEHRLHSDIGRDDVVFWFTTCGWMMWNWLVSALAAEATLVLYDGSPGHPDLETLWKLAESAGITHFGTSPKFLAANANAGLIPSEVADLSALRWIGSTGAPLNPEQFDWVYANVKRDVHLASVSGGTDIVGCFAIGAPILPVRRGELQARALGMAVEAWDEDGRHRTGVKGELVCTRPFPSMPVSFWNDPTGKWYRSAYFEENPGVWTHGDFIEVRPKGGVVIYGRSDTTLNPGGVRIGTAEIYRAIESMPEVEDSIAVGHRRKGDIDVILFVKLATGVNLEAELVTAIKQRIRTEATPRHVPAHVLHVADIPYTLSGKKVEKAVQLTIMGQSVVNRDAIGNPASLDEYREVFGNRNHNTSDH